MTNLYNGDMTTTLAYAAQPDALAMPVDVYPVSTPKKIAIDRARVSSAGKGNVIQFPNAPLPKRVEDHTAEPIKSLDDIRRITKFLIDEERYRDHMLFVVGINCALRVSDMMRLQFSDLLDDNCQFRDSFSILEKKTANTRKVRKNRFVAINRAVCDAVCLYIDHHPEVCLDDYLFVHERNGIRMGDSAMTRMGVHNMLKGIAKDCGLTIQMSSHTLRKTFGFHQLRMSGNDPRKLMLLKEMFGHSSLDITMAYIGITKDEITDAYMGLNLGGDGYDYDLMSTGNGDDEDNVLATNDNMAATEDDVFSRTSDGEAIINKTERSDFSTNDNVATGYVDAGSPLKNKKREMHPSKTDGYDVFGLTGYPSFNRGGNTFGKHSVRCKGNCTSQPFNSGRVR